MKPNAHRRPGVGEQSVAGDPITRILEVEGAGLVRPTVKAGGRERTRTSTSSMLTGS